MMKRNPLQTEPKTPLYSSFLSGDIQDRYGYLAHDKKPGGDEQSGGTTNIEDNCTASGCSACCESPKPDPCPDPDPYPDPHKHKHPHHPEHPPKHASWFAGI